LEILRLEAPGIEIEAVLAAAFTEYKTHGFSDMWEDAVSDSAPRDDHEYRDGFGGLRLAMAIPAPDVIAVTHP
jgi:hypothetical protein